MQAKTQLLIMAGIAFGVAVLQRHNQYKKINALRVKVGEIDKPDNKTILIQNVLLVTGLIGASSFLYYGFKK